MKDIHFDIRKNKFYILSLVALTIVMCLRMIEGTFIFYNTGFSFSLLQKEFIGLLFDFALLITGGIILLPIYLLIARFSAKAGTLLFLFGLGILSVAHLLIDVYFIYEGSLLDIFVYKYPIREIWFTVSTSNLPLTAISVGGIGIFLLPFFLYFFFKRYIRNTPHIVSSSRFYLLLFFGGIIGSSYYFFGEINPYSKNKSLDFYVKSIQYAFSNQKIHSMTEADLVFFQSQYPQKEFISKDFPLLHQSSTNSGGLFEQMDSFNTPPNVVILIVEGLNDDFIQDTYHAIPLMPFMNELKSKSLYWNRCFSQGERSFAAVPAILGSLPFGEDGFTSLDIYPYHHSLINLFQSHGYQTNYFTGVDAWFHTINKWMHYNDAHLVFDKTNFDSSFQKIYADDYFWGYNDKDLYRQYFKVLDTLPQQPYLNVFFTQSSHPPYIIPNEKKYREIIRSYQNADNQSFIRSYLKYLATIRFVDEGLQNFFEEYQKRSDYENTIFILTGDHPNTELPRENALKKYHVPMLIFSPKLKHAETFNNDVCHLDVMPTLADFIRHYGIKFPKSSSALGQSLFLKTPREIPFMTGNFELNDYYSNGTFIAKDKSYKVDGELNLTPLKDENKIQQIEKKRANFRIINEEVSFKNKIMPRQVYLNGILKKKIYFNTNKKTIHIAQEFTDAIKEISIHDSLFSVDAMLQFSSKSKDDLLLVYQVTDEKDSVLLWESFSLNHVTKLQFRKTYHFPKATLPLQFKAVIWNQQKKKSTTILEQTYTITYP